MEYRPIRHLTDEHLRTGRLVVANGCNGAHFVGGIGGTGYFSADDVKRDPWEWFLILPETPTD